MCESERERGGHKRGHRAAANKGWLAHLHELCPCPLQFLGGQQHTNQGQAHDGQLSLALCLALTTTEEHPVEQEEGHGGFRAVGSVILLTLQLAPRSDGLLETAHSARVLLQVLQAQAQQMVHSCMGLAGGSSPGEVCVCVVCVLYL